MSSDSPEQALQEDSRGVNVNGDSVNADMESLRKQLEEEQSRRKKANTNLFETKEKLNKIQKEWEDEKKSYDDKIEDLNNTINLQAEENDLLQQLVETREQELAEERRAKENVQFQLECIQGDIEEYKHQIQQKDRTIDALRKSRHAVTANQDEHETDSLEGRATQGSSPTSSDIQLASPSGSVDNRMTPVKKRDVSVSTDSNGRSSKKREAGSSPTVPRNGYNSRNTQELSSDYERLKGDLEHYKQKALESSQQLQSMESEISSLKRELNQLRKSESSLNSQQQSLEQSNVELQSQLRVVRSQLEQEQNTTEQLRRTNRELTSEKADLESTVSILKRQTQYNQADNEDTMKQLRERIKNLQEQLEQSRNENLNLAQDNGNVRANIRNMEHALAQFVSQSEFDPSYQKDSSLHVSAPAIVSGVAKDITRYLKDICHYFNQESQKLQRRTELLEEVPRSVDSWNDYLSWVFKQDSARVSDNEKQKAINNVNTVSEAISNFSSIVKNFQHFSRLQDNHWKSVVSRALTEYCNVKEQLKQRTVDVQNMQYQMQQLEKDLQDAADYGAFVRKENQQLQEQAAAISEVAARNSSSEEQARQLSTALQEYRQEISRLQQSLESQQNGKHQPIEGSTRSHHSSPHGGNSTKILKDTIRDQKYEISSLRQRIKEKDSQLQHLQEQLHSSTERTKQRLKSKELQVQHLEHQLQSTAEQLQLNSSSKERDVGKTRGRSHTTSRIPSNVQPEDIFSYAADLSMLCEEDEVGTELVKRLLGLLERRSRGEEQDDDVSETDIDLGEDPVKLKKHIVNLEKSFSILQRQCENIVQDYLNLSRRIEEHH